MVLKCAVALGLALIWGALLAAELLLLLYSTVGPTILALGAGDLRGLWPKPDGPIIAAALLCWTSMAVAFVIASLPRRAAAWAAVLVGACISVAAVLQATSKFHLAGWPTVLMLAVAWLVAAIAIAKVVGPGVRAMARFDATIAEVEDAVGRRFG